MAELAILIPTLQREHLIEPLLESIDNTVPDATVVFLTTWNDRKVKAKLMELNQRVIDVPRRGRGDYARKINTGYLETTEPLLFLGAQDIIFHDGWFEKAKAKLTDKIRVVGTNDLGNKRVTGGEHSTHTLVTRDYINKYGTIDEPNKVLCEEYFHEFVDDEFIATAKYRGAFDMALDSVVEHMHPAWGKAKWDASYREVDKRFYRGAKIFQERRKLWTK